MWAKKNNAEYFTREAPICGMTRENKNYRRHFSHRVCRMELHLLETLSPTAIFRG